MPSPWDGFPTPEPFVDAANRFITPGLTHSDSPQAFKMPSMEEMRMMGGTPEGQEQLRALLERYGIGSQHLNYFKTSATGYVQRMTTISDPEDFKRAVNDLIDNRKGRALVGAARRVQQRYAALRDIDGNINQKMIRIEESDESTCENCDALAGEIRTFADWAGEMPGAESCYGGDSCRGSLHPID